VPVLDIVADSFRESPQSLLTYTRTEPSKAISVTGLGGL
jgi:hypothetical protein